MISAEECLTAAIDALVAKRPKALRYFNNNTGQWSAVLAGYRAQLNLVRRRMADEIISRRLKYAKGDALRDLTASEFNTTLTSDPQVATGHITLNRSGGMPAGVVRAGHPFTLLADPDASPLPLQSAEYEVTQSVVVAAGTSFLSLPVKAKRAGIHANIPISQNTGFVKPVLGRPLFDTSYTVSTAMIGGGSSGLNDDVLRAAAQAYSLGQYGPIQDAVIAGALRTQGVRHFAYQESNGVARIFIGDESWSTSTEWCNAVGQYINDSFLGFGCLVVCTGVSNTFAQIALTVRLKTSQDLIDTTEVETAIRSAVSAYFNDRSDWHVWRLSALRAAVSRSHHKILACTVAAVSDFVSAAPLSEPPLKGNLSAGGRLIHYYVPDNAVTVTFLPPT